MSRLKITEDLTGTEIGFPVSGMPATSTEGKLYRAAFWVCIFMPGMMASMDGNIGFIAVLMSAVVLLTLAYRSRKLSLYIDRRTLQIRSPWKRHAIPLEEIRRFEIIKDDHTSSRYILVHTDSEAYTASSLLTQKDAERLHGLLEAGHAARLAEGLTEPARPPEALRALMSEAQRP